MSLPNALPRYDSTYPEKMTIAICARISTLSERASEQTSLAFATMSTVYKPIFTLCVLNDPGQVPESLRDLVVSGAETNAQPPYRPARDGLFAVDPDRP